MERPVANRARSADLWVTAVILAACLGSFAARWLVAGRLWGVRYDFLASWFDGPVGEGFVELDFVLWSYLVGVFGCLACLYALARRLGGRRWIWLLALPVVAMPLLGLERSPSERDMTVVIRNAEPLILALDNYRKDHGACPPNLDTLVPKYIRATPDTGLIKGRRFLYIPRDAKPESGRDMRLLPSSVRDLAGNDYVLAVLMVPAGTLVYRPNGDYGDLPGRDAGKGWRRTYID